MAIEVFKGLSWEQLDFDMKQKCYRHWKLLLKITFYSLPNALRHRNIKVTAKADRSFNSLKWHEGGKKISKMIPIIIFVVLSVIIVDRDRSELLVRLTYETK